METSDLYEVEQLSLFGDQLSFGFGSPMEPDSPVNSPSVGFESNQLDLLATEQLADKPKTVNSSPVIELGQHPVHGSPNGLEVGWMDKQYDLGDWLNEPKATSPDAECSEANVIALSLAVEDIPVVNVPTDVPWSSTEDGTLGVDVNENVEDGVEVDLLSEAFKLLDKAGISVDDLVQFKQFIDDTETAQCETSVSSKLDPSDLLFTESGASSSDSGLDSLPSSSPQSPAFNVQLSNTVAVPPSEPSRAKSRRGRRSAPYSNKLPADRKERKKIQNKTAALKYRQKKKEETKKVFTEVEILEAKNKELKNKVESITQEINYLKDLMAEVFKAKLVSV